MVSSSSPAEGVWLIYLMGISRSNAWPDLPKHFTSLRAGDFQIETVTPQMMKKLTPPAPHFNIQSLRGPCDDGDHQIAFIALHAPGTDEF
jgi:hypothetical protein